MTAEAKPSFDSAFFIRLADWLTVGVALALPWSTSATAICIVAWLLVLLPTLDAAALRREVLTPAGGLPVLLWGLGALGMLWADVAWSARFSGLSGFDRLLVIPLLLAQFRRSEHGVWVLWAFFVSCGLLLIVSFIRRAVPVHDYIFQSTEFVICAFAALGVACREGRRRHGTVALGFSGLAALFLGNVAFVATSRTSLVVAPILAVLLGWRELGHRGIVSGAVLAIAIGAASWFASPYLRERLNVTFDEMRAYHDSSQISSTGLHTAFLSESLTIVSSAPIIGHGTGSISDQFRRVTAGGSGAGAVATVNPHDQTFAIAIQLGVVGALVLWAMWIAHILLFRATSPVAWFGLVVVVENIVSSIFHTHLFDFANGWLYVLGVGVLGGMVSRERSTNPVESPR
jgi:O-antigen ligase